MTAATQPTRVCTKCRVEKPNTGDFFAKSRSDCKACHSAITKTNRAKTLALQALPESERPLALHTLPPANTPENMAKRAAIIAARAALTGKVGAKPANITPRQLSAAVALKDGLDLVNSTSNLVVETMKMYLADQNHPRHAWAMEEMLARIMPVRMYTALGLKEAGVAPGQGDGAKQRPQISINIVHADGRAATLPTATIDVKALPHREADADPGGDQEPEE